MRSTLAYSTSLTPVAVAVRPAPRRDPIDAFFRGTKVRNLEPDRSLPPLYMDGVHDDAPWLNAQMERAAATDGVVNIPPGNLCLLTPTMWHQMVQIVGASERTTIRVRREWWPFGEEGND